MEKPWASGREVPVNEDLPHDPDEARSNKNVEAVESVQLPKAVLEECQILLNDHTRISDWVCNHLNYHLNDEVQYELARLLYLLEVTEDSRIKKVMPEITVAVKALLSDEPKLQLARTIRYRLEMEALT